MSSHSLEAEDSPFWSLETLEARLYDDLQLSSGSELEEEALELTEKSRKHRFLTIKTGDIVRRMKVNWSELRGGYVERRKENYRRILGMVRQRVKKRRDGEPPMVATPDESELSGMTEEEKEKQRQIWQQELAKVEEEIQTLKHVMQSKLRDSQELKRKLGISVWREISEDLSQGVRNVKESNVYLTVEEKVTQLGKAVTEAPIYQNVEEKFTHIGKVVSENPAYQKTESVVKATAESTRTLLGGLTGGFTHKMGQLKNSESFRSLEERMGSAYENVKTRVSSRSSSMQSFDEALREETARRATSPTSPTIPEGKQLA